MHKEMLNGDKKQMKMEILPYPKTLDLFLLENQC